MNLIKNNLNTSALKSPTARKSFKQFKPLIIISSLTVGLSLSSCVDPAYNAYGHNNQYSSYNSGYSPGYRISSLPSGYRSENISGRTYYYHDGHYYQPSSGGYTVVSAPSTSRYYSDYNRYRQTTSRSRDNSYSSTQVVTRLPSGYREVNHSGNTYYQAGDRYYSRQGNGYVVVQRPY